MKIRELKLVTVAAVLALGVGLAACGSSEQAAAPPPAEPPPPPPHVCEAGPSQACVDARQAELDALGGDATVAEQDALQMALDEAQSALAAHNAAEARQGLVDAAMCTDGTEACVADHKALVAALKADLARLAASGDATNAQEAAARKALADAEEERDVVQMALFDANRNTDTGMKVTAAETAAEGLEDARSDADITAAEAAIKAAKDAIAEGDDPDAFMAEIGAAEMAVARAKARNTVDAAVMAAETASNALDADQSKAAVDKARTAVEAAEKAVADHADALTDADESGFNAQITLAKAKIGPLESLIAARGDAADRARVARAARLYDGIARNSSAQTFYSTDAGTMGDLQVRFDVNGDNFNGGDPTADDGFGDQSEDAFLSEDKDAEVAGLHGWTGRRYTASKPIVIAGGRLPGTYRGTYEAMVWSKIGEPKEGEKFSTEYSAVFTGGTLSETATEDAAGRGRVASPSFDHTAGLKRFKLPENRIAVMIPGSYHGVAGTYSCTPGAGTCAASFAGPGFELGGVDAAGFAATKAAWTFRPTDASARVISAEDTVYPSYGWWLHTAEGGRLTASAFTLIRNTDGVTSAARRAEADALRARIPHEALYGTATYVGGAAGQYALASPTGGTNDAGAFTARATLEAAFNDGSLPYTSGSVTGTIDGFTGADGEDRDWKVELKPAGATGYNLSGSRSDGTVWTIGDTAAGASGTWGGEFHEAGDDGVPKVVTGTFRTEFGTDGIMVGAFGTDRQE